MYSRVCLHRLDKCFAPYKVHWCRIHSCTGAQRKEGRKKSVSRSEKGKEKVAWWNRNATGHGAAKQKVNRREDEGQNIAKCDACCAMCAEAGGSLPRGPMLQLVRSSLAKTVLHLRPSAISVQP